MNPLMPPRSLMLKLMLLVAWADRTALEGSGMRSQLLDPELREWLAEARRRELLKP